MSCTQRISKRPLTSGQADMSVILDRPLVIFAASLLAQWLAAYIGDLFRARVRPLSKDQREDFDTIQTASLTLLAVIIGFSFSMAVTRYDQRKNYEEAEANAIGTEYLRADLLQAEDAARVRDLLKQYLDLASRSMKLAIGARSNRSRPTLLRFRPNYGQSFCARPMPSRQP
jgi:hypothetical protein